ncbi:hypothetical protein COCCADRAFT_104218 [Bipolaris zeicola 26-R-13]|uniref:Uncharacterized protein n=1 Tax=Cochliobolus carbonum (strain 26-R-13) TaxID=930089 RepID=W6YGG8_COCC2|nr:uncharacterized protein COCCADRAFT_104218 [Bipolaris zeicola 26-R-13]EUC30341.1 hypothetical protein COCCADRAFT_104218 [Bipolaris zeicola 26-R-13]
MAKASQPASQTPKPDPVHRVRVRVSLSLPLLLPACLSASLFLHPRLPSSSSSTSHTTLPPLPPFHLLNCLPLNAQLPAYPKATLHRSTLRTRHYSSTRRSLLVSAYKRIAPLPHLAARD